jgi:hypothetical protein
LNDKQQKNSLVTSQLFHWGSTLIAVMVVYAFFHSGQIQNETVSLVILLILSLSTFLDGIHVGWQFSVIGVLLAISAVIISYLDEYIWIIAIIALVTAIRVLPQWNSCEVTKLFFCCLSVASCQPLAIAPIAKTRVMANQYKWASTGEKLVIAIPNSESRTNVT